MAKSWVKYLLKGEHKGGCGTVAVSIEGGAVEMDAIRAFSYRS
jgi:hypothetical protein